MQEFATSLGLGVNEAKAIVSVVVVVAYVFVRWLLLRIVHRQVKDEEVWYRTRKIVTYVAFLLIVLTLVRIWVVPFGDLATYLGLVSAGVAVALADVLKNMVGWGYILSRRPFRVGDRIETEAFSGDVIDIRLFRFTILEIGNWVNADHSTGRIVHIPNQVVFTGPIANYTEGFEFIWHEIPILVTFESDWKKAETIIRDVIGKAAPDVTGTALSELRKTAQAYRIKYGHMTPTVYVSTQDTVSSSLPGCWSRYAVAAMSTRKSGEGYWTHSLQSRRSTSPIRPSARISRGRYASMTTAPDRCGS